MKRFFEKWLCLPLRRCAAAQHKMTRGPSYASRRSRNLALGGKREPETKGCGESSLTIAHIALADGGPQGRFWPRGGRASMEGSTQGSLGSTAVARDTSVLCVLPAL